LTDFVITIPEERKLWYLYWEEGKECPEYQTWLTGWKCAWPKPPLLSLKEWRHKKLLRVRKLALANPPDILTEQSMNFLPLPVNPDTGELNPNSLPLESIWILEALLDPIITDPVNNITKILKDPEAIHVPVDFRARAAPRRRRGPSEEESGSFVGPIERRTGVEGLRPSPRSGILGDHVAEARRGGEKGKGIVMTGPVLLSLNGALDFSEGCCE